MPTTRRKTPPRLIGQLTTLTAAQREHLVSGLCLGPEAFPFTDAAQLREAWQRHRGEILAGWDRPGRRPDAFWTVELGLRSVGWPKGLDWPRGAVSEADAVHKLVVAGEIQPCVPDELQQIEKRWLGLIEGWAPLHCRDADCAGEMLEHHYGVPQSYSRPRLPAAFLAARKDRERWRGKLARLGEDVALVGAEPDD